MLSVNSESCTQVFQVLEKMLNTLFWNWIIPVTTWTLVLERHWAVKQKP